MFSCKLESQPVNINGKLYFSNEGNEERYKYMTIVVYKIEHQHKRSEVHLISKLAMQLEIVWV